jgi:hypothetical protein
MCATVVAQVRGQGLSSPTHPSTASHAAWQSSREVVVPLSLQLSPLHALPIVSSWFCTVVQLPDAPPVLRSRRWWPWGATLVSVDVSRPMLRAWQRTCNRVDAISCVSARGQRASSQNMMCAQAHKGSKPLAGAMSAKIPALNYTPGVLYNGISAVQSSGWGAIKVHGTRSCLTFVGVSLGLKWRQGQLMYCSRVFRTRWALE